MEEEVILTPKELAKRWKISSITLGQWRWNGRGPQFKKRGRRVNYKFQEIEQFETKALRFTANPSAPCVLAHITLHQENEQRKRKEA